MRRFFAGSIIASAARVTTRSQPRIRDSRRLTNESRRNRRITVFEGENVERADDDDRVLMLCSQLRFRKQSAALCSAALRSGGLVCNTGGFLAVPSRREIAVVFARNAYPIGKRLQANVTGCESVGKKFCIMYNSWCYFSRVYERGRRLNQ